MTSKRHFTFNVALILLPWLSVLFLGKRNIRRYSLTGSVTVILEMLNQVIGQQRSWWVFYDKPKSFIKDVLPFSIGPYMPIAMWILKLSYGNFIKFLFLNAVADGLFAFPGIKMLKKMKIANLKRLSGSQFFLYLFYKAFIMYGVQYFVEKKQVKN
ncbi:hypothetical protein [Neobacillus sp. LXY-4]|uniref:hypothetical protein n=1 Tax=Neobacillus sp. LXY-4 TaxID=3379826 RepID=UPI003EE3A3B4